MQDLIHGMHILQSCLKSWDVLSFSHLVAGCHCWGQSENRSDPGDGHSAVCSVVVEVISWLVSASSQGDHDFLSRYACVRDDTPFAPLSCILEWPRSLNGEEERATASAFLLGAFLCCLQKTAKIFLTWSHRGWATFCNASRRSTAWFSIRRQCQHWIESYYVILLCRTRLQWIWSFVFSSTFVLISGFWAVSARDSHSFGSAANDLQECQCRVLRGSCCTQIDKIEALCYGFGTAAEVRSQCGASLWRSWEVLCMSWSTCVRKKSSKTYPMRWCSKPVKQQVFV